MAKSAMYTSIPGAFETYDSPSFGSGAGRIWDPSPSLPNLVPKIDVSATSTASAATRTYRKIAKPVHRSENFIRPSHPASSAAVPSSSYTSYNNDFSAKRRKRGPEELNTDLADDNFMPSVKSAMNGGPMPSTSLKIGLKREFGEDDSEDEGLMKDSYFSDTNYRRNCGVGANGIGAGSTHELDDRGGKRRLLNVVGSMVGSIWEFCTSQMPNSLAGMLPKIGWSTAAAEYYDTPFNAPPGLFDVEDFTSGMDYAKESSIPGAFNASFTKPTLRSIIPPSPAKEDADPFASRSPDYSLLDEDMSMSKSKFGGIDSPMSASWIMVKPENNSSRASSPIPTSPRAAASAASMRRSGSNNSSRPSTPVFSTPPVPGYRRQTSYSRPVPSRKLRGVARPTVYSTSGSRSSFISKGSTNMSGSSTSSNSSSNNNNYGNFSLSSHSTFTSNFSSQPPSSFSPYGFGGSVASSATSIGSMPTSPIRSGSASVAGQRTSRAATVSGPSAAPRRRYDEDDDLAEMDKFSKQLRAMIREGKEALGSKIEVLDCEDEGDW